MSASPHVMWELHYALMFTSKRDNGFGNSKSQSVKMASLVLLFYVSADVQATSDHNRLSLCQLISI